MPGVARLRDRVNKSRIVQASKDVFANEPGKAASPTTSVEVTPVTLSPSQLAVHANLIANPATYDNPYNREKGIVEGADMPAREDNIPGVVAAPTQTVKTCSRGSAASVDTLIGLIQQTLQEAKGTQAWQALFRKTGTSNPNVVQLYTEVGYPGLQDNTAWCAAFTGTMLKRSCYKFLKTLSSRAYLNYGTPIPDISQARRGDILIFPRPTAGPEFGHVCFFWDYNGSNSVTVIGGNQSSNVTMTNYRYFPNRILGIRRPIR